MTDRAELQILDLHGRQARVLHLPGTLAAACWLLATIYAIGALLFILYMLQKFVLPPGGTFSKTPAWLLNTETVSLYGGQILAMSIFLIADPAPGKFSPWPRRLMAAVWILVTGISTINAVVTNIDDAVWRGADGSDFFTQLDLPLRVVGGALDVASGLFALWFLLQLASWLERPALRWASVVLGTFATLLSGAGLLLQINFWLVFSDWTSGLPDWGETLISRVHEMGQTLLEALLACFLGVIAVRLGRSRRKAKQFASEVRDGRSR